MAARARPGPALSLFPVLFALLLVAATAQPGSAKPRVYLSSWAVRVAAGLRDARALARRHGLLYLGQVRPGRGKAGPAHPLRPRPGLVARTRHCLSPSLVPWASSTRAGCSRPRPTSNTPWESGNPVPHPQCKGLSEGPLRAHPRPQLSILPPSDTSCSSCTTAPVKFTVLNPPQAGLAPVSPGEADSSSLCPQVMEGEPFHHFSHRGTRHRALSRHWGWHMRLSRDPQVGRGARGARAQLWAGTAWHPQRCSCCPGAVVRAADGEEALQERPWSGAHGSLVPQAVVHGETWLLLLLILTQIRHGRDQSGASSATSLPSTIPEHRIVPGLSWDIPRETPPPLWFKAWSPHSVEVLPPVQGEFLGSVSARSCGAISGPHSAESQG